MSDTSGLPNTNSEGVPDEEDPERFGAGTGSDAQSAEPAETDPGNGAQASGPPPADFDPAQEPSNPDLVGGSEPPDQ